MLCRLLRWLFLPSPRVWFTFEGPNFHLTTREGFTMRLTTEQRVDAEAETAEIVFGEAEFTRKWASRTFALAAFVILYSALALAWGWIEPGIWAGLQPAVLTLYFGLDYLKGGKQT